MEELFLPDWLIVVMIGVAGAWVFVLVRPINGGWRQALGAIFSGSVIGAVLPFVICEWMGWTTLPQKQAVALLSGLLGVTLAKTVVSIFEQDARGLILRAIKRMLGVHDSNGGPRHDRHKRNNQGNAPGTEED